MAQTHTIIRLPLTRGAFFKFGELPVLIADAMHPEADTVAEAWCAGTRVFVDESDPTDCTAETVSLLRWAQTRTDYRQWLERDAMSGTLTVLDASSRVPYAQRHGGVRIEAALAACVVHVSALVAWGELHGLEFVVAGGSADKRSNSELGERPADEGTGELQPAEAVPVSEAVDDRQSRRLARLRALGCDFVMRSGRWSLDGKRGAFGQLEKEEKAAGRPNANKPELRADLEAAAKRERSAAGLLGPLMKR